MSCVHHMTICHMTVKERVNYSHKSQGAKGGKPFSAVVLQGAFLVGMVTGKRVLPSLVGRSQGC